MPAREVICPACGEHNDLMTEFCNACNTYLAWDPANGPDERTLLLPQDLQQVPPVRPPVRDPGGQDAAGQDALRARRRALLRQDIAEPSPGPAVPSIARGPGGSGRPAGDLMKVAVEPSSATVVPGQPEAEVRVRVFNLSAVVDRYTVEVLDAPLFVLTQPAEVNLLPRTDESITLTIGVAATPLPPAGVHTLTIRVRSSAQQAMAVSSRFVFTIGVVDGPVLLTLMPAVLRLKDTASGATELTAENPTGNRPVTLQLAGSDPESRVRFEFVPPKLTVPAGGTAVAQVRLTVPVPDPGQEANTAVTVTATEGSREFSISGAVSSATSAAQLELRLEPALIKVRDTRSAAVRLVVSNTGGRPAQLMLRGSDDERAIRFTFSPPVLQLRPGGTAACSVRLDFLEPEAGQEISRQFTVWGHDGRQEISTVGTLTTLTSPQNLAIWLEPSLLRVRDSSSGYLSVVVDNRNSRRPERLVLSGTDPERSVRFAFQPPVLDIAAGQIVSVGLWVDAALPEHGTEISRPVTVVATGAEGRRVEASGTVLQASSASALEIRLDPSVVRVRDAGDAVLNVIADNRDGAVPVRVQLVGSDPERVVGFVFDPPVLDLGPGEWAYSRTVLRAPRPERGQEVSRQITVTAADERREVSATGSYIQTSSDRRPVVRVVLTIVGALLMIAGVFLPWTAVPRITGINFSLTDLADATKVDLRSLNINVPQLRRIPRQLISAGLIVLVLAALSLFGLTGSKGRLTRTMAALVLLFVLAFAAALLVRADTFSVGVGAVLVVLGALCSFAGSLVGRR